MPVPTADAQSATPPVDQSGGRLLSGMLSHYRGYGRQLGIGAALAVPAAAAEVLALALLVPLAAAAASDGRYSDTVGGVHIDLGVGGLTILAGSVVLVRLMLGVAMAAHEASLVARYEADQRLRSIRAFLGSDWRRQSAERAGLMLNALTVYVARSQQGMRTFVAGTRTAVSMMVLVMGAVAIGGPTGLVVLVAAAGIAALLRPLLQATRRHAGALAASASVFANQVSELVAAVREIRVFGAELPMAERLHETVNDIQQDRRAQMFLASATPLGYESAGLLLVVLGLFVLNRFDVGDLEAKAAMVLLIVRALAYGRFLQSQYQLCADAFPYVLGLEEVISEYDASRRRTGTTPIDRVDRIEVSHVSFAYGDQPALRDVSFRVARGEAIGIVGPSGSGKSTLIDVLLGLWEVDGGSVLVDGRDISEFEGEMWHRVVALVPQKSVLVSGSARDNIRFFRPYLSDVTIDETARTVGLIYGESALGQGLDTLVGEGGMQVSGGQRQRIAIARALVGEPEVIILDEPTASLDVHSEIAVHAALEAAKPQTTIVMVAHRLTTLSLCDRILVMREGRIVESGTFEELERSSRYFASAVRVSQGSGDGKDGAEVRDQSP